MANIKSMLRKVYGVFFYLPEEEALRQQKNEEKKEKKNLQKAVLEEAEKTMKEVKSGWVPPKPMPPASKVPQVSKPTKQSTPVKRSYQSNRYVDQQALENARLKHEAEQNHIRDIERQNEIDRLHRQQDDFEDEIRRNQTNIILTDILVDQLHNRHSQSTYQGGRGGMTDGGGASGDWEPKSLVDTPVVDTTVETTSCQASDYTDNSRDSDTSTSDDTSSSDSSDSDDN